ncbi:MAG: hypothetical protein J6K39_03570 [Clostridia bacterium]|nr:hypothetical protein [Clostridia bacterium]
MGKDKKVVKQYETIKFSMPDYQFIFDTWMKTIREKTYDLKAPNSENFFKFYEILCSGAYELSRPLPQAILKSYAQNSEDVSEYVDIDKLKVRDNYKLICKFFNEHALEGETIDCKNGQELNRALANIIAKRIQQAEGDIVYVDISKMHLYKNASITPIRNFYVEALAKLGYKQDPVMKNLYVSDRKVPVEISENNQSWILKQYVERERWFTDEFYIIFGKVDDPEEFSHGFELFEKYLKTLEERMSEQTRTSEKFLMAKADFEKFVEKQKAAYHEKLTRSKRFASYYKPASEALWRRLKKNPAENDDVIIKDFIKLVENVHFAMNVVDENGKKYPANYFLFTEMHPNDMVSLLIVAEKANCFDEKQAKKSAEVKAVLRNLDTAAMTRTEDGASYDLDMFLSKYRAKTNFNGIDLDLRLEENFREFANKVDTMIKENNLPTTQVCVNALAREMIKGCSPINTEILKNRAIERQK